MKKAFYFLTAFSFLAVSCSKEGFEPNNSDPTADPGRLTVVTGNDLDGGIIPMNQTFTVSGKAAQLSYTYKVYAESPIINGLQTAATSVGSVGASGSGSEYVFVGWHTEGSPTGGAIAAYRNNGTDYSYVARVDFDDTDWHDLAVEFVSANEFTIYLAGQREPDSSGYLLSTHKGAVAGKITFNTAIPEKFDIANYEEIPLPSFGANGLVLDGSNVQVITGNGTGSASNPGGIYQIDASNFDFVTDAYTNTSAFEDGEFIAKVTGSYTHIISGATAIDGLYALEREGSSDVKLHDDNTGSFAPTASGTASAGTLDNERNALSSYITTSDADGEDKIGVLAALGTNGLWFYNTDVYQFTIDIDPGVGVVAGTPVPTFSQVNALGSAAIGASHDATNDLVYVAAGGGGLHVLADGDYANGKSLVDAFDLIGKFIPPTGAPFNSNFVVKDVNVYNTSEIAIASGNGGMFFVEQN